VVSARPSRAPYRDALGQGADGAQTEDIVRVCRVGVVDLRGDDVELVGQRVSGRPGTPNAGQPSSIFSAIAGGHALERQTLRGQPHRPHCTQYR